MDVIVHTWDTLLFLLTGFSDKGVEQFVWKLFPYFLFLELPLYVFILLGILKYYLRKDQIIPENRPYYPTVSCIVTCYSEGEDIKKTIISLAEQIYEGHIEILPIIDGARQNENTYRAAKSMEIYVCKRPKRSLHVIPKWQRGGKVSSLNIGLQFSTGEIVMSLDGETSFDNTMVSYATRHFENTDVVAVAGNLRVRNAFKNLATRLQAIEYQLSIHASKVGLNEFNAINCISGAFGIFRKSFLKKIGGWDSGAAEDLDLTLRMKSYFGRYPRLKILFEPKAMGHTDAPETFRGLFDQRMRWDGDLFYLYVRKHYLSFNSHIFGWRALIIYVWTGLFFQLVMPFIIIIYSAYIFIVYPLGVVLAVYAMIYLAYLVITIIFYLVFLTMLSERRPEDLRLAVLLPIMPFYNFSLRVCNGIATLKSIFMKTHLDTSLEPWWVLRKTKF
ncbi:MAG: glycosyltransferase [Thermodesulfobacteriota bacterium]|nr:glycosyltransferase [Thermodesulfobacteriota bacterium]